MPKLGDYKIFTLHVTGLNINNVTLDDIAKYLSDFADLLGKEAEPRYHSIKGGSMNFAAKVEPEREMDVKTRTFLLRTGDAPEDAVRAQQRLSKRLGFHRARQATLVDSSQAKVIEIPIERYVPEDEIPLLAKSGSLQGRVIRVGGRQEIVSVELQDVDGHVYLCKASREKAKLLGQQLFDKTIRVHGTGRMRRCDGVWYVEDFHIADFDILEDDSFADVLSELRKIPATWINREGSFEELERLRNGENP